MQENKFRKPLHLKPKPEIYLPQSAIDIAISKAKEIQSGNFEKQLKKYRVDYIVWDKIADPNWRFDSQKFTKKIFEDQNFKIYKIL